MKILRYIFAISLFPIIVAAVGSDDFITTWKTTIVDENITIPTTGVGYDYNISWGDGTTSTGQTGNTTHTYASTGTYTVKISGDFPRIYFNDSGDKDKILSIEQWGTGAWTSMDSAFQGCSNLVGQANDTPDLRSVSSLYRMFNKASSFNQNINDWNVSNITRMDGIFYDATAFNQDIGDWNVSKVTRMNNMFQRSSFNQDISSWDVANVENMAFMFNGVTLSTTNYDNILIGWNGQTLQSGVTFSGGNSKYCAGESARADMNSTDNWTITDGGKDCTGIILSTDYFITIWQTDNNGTSNNNQITIPTTGGGYDYNISWGDGTTSTGHTGNATHTYASTGTYTVKISGDFPRIYFNDSGDKDKILSIEQWGTGAWTSMNSAFYGCSNLAGQASDSPDLSNITSMSNIFRDTTSFNQNISNWDVSNVTNMYAMFRDATSFNQSIGNWDVSSVTNMHSMFFSTFAFNQDISLWDVSSVTDMTYMFRDATSFNQNIGDWNVSGVTNMYAMFLGASSFNQDIGSWNVGNVTKTRGMFHSATSFNQDISSWDVSKVNDISFMFYKAYVFNQDISDWNVSNTTDMSYMFQLAYLFDQNISKWNIGNVTAMKNMFYRAYAFNQDIGDWNVSNVTDMNGTFNQATAFNQDISSWDISNVKWMVDMFKDVNLSMTNYDNLLIGWDGQTLQNGVTFDGGDSNYCAGEIARVNMTNSDNWTITDGGKGCNNICDIVTDVNKTECNALLALYNDTNGSNWINDENWTTSTTVGNWYGITVSSGHVSKIDLHQNNLVGTIPSEIGDLNTGLTSLILDRNFLSGSIPIELWNLTNLQRLILYNNSLSGAIPSEIGNLINLTALDIHGNPFGGTIPDELWSLTHLSWLYIQGCSLDGQISINIINLTGLKGIKISSNQFDGVIPIVVANHTSLIQVIIGNNNFVFSDFETNHIDYTSLAYYGYAPQSKVDTDRAVGFFDGGTLTITSEVSENNSTHDRYKWFKDGIEIVGATDRIYTKANASSVDEGVYTYEITNTVVTGLTLSSNNITVSIAVPIAEYRFDECSWNGTAEEVKDSSVNGLHGNIYGNTIPSSGKINNSAYFDGDGDYIKVLNDPKLQIIGDFSASMWIYPEQFSHGRQPLVFKHYAHEFEIILEDGGAINYYHGDNLAEDITILPYTTISENTWNHIVITRDDTNKIIKLFINGSFIGQDSYEKNITSGDKDLHIGFRDDGSNFAFKGKLDELKLYNVTLADNLIQDIYNNENSHKNYDSSHRMVIDCTTPSLLAEYRFDECDRYTGKVGEIIDRQGRDNNGTIVGDVNLSKDEKKIGYALSLNGGAVDIDNLAVTNEIYKKYTVMFWMYWDGVGNVMPFSWSYYDLYIASGKFGFNSISGDIYGITSTGLENGWHHISAVFTNGDIYSNRLYIDGVEQSLSQQLGTPNTPSSIIVTPEARIGGWRSSGSNTYRFKSYLDEFKIYKGEVNATTIMDTYTFENSMTRDVECVIFNAVNRAGGCFNWNNNITTKIAGDDINLTILASDENDNNTSLGDVNVTKLELLSFNDVGCSTLYDSTEIWSGNQEVNGSSCFNPPLFTHNKAIKCAKIRISGIFDGVFAESNSTDTFSIRPDKFKLKDISTGKLLAEGNYTFKAEALNSDGSTLTVDFNTSVTPQNQKYFRDGSDGSVMFGTFVSIADFIFTDGGIADTTLSFNNVGKIGLELNDTTWAEVDSDDTPWEDRMIYLEHNLTFIPDRFEINFASTPLMDNHGRSFTYFSNDLNMSADLKNLSFTITALGKNGGVMTNYQTPQTTYFSNDINLSLQLTVEQNPIISAKIISQSDFIAGVKTISYDDRAFNFGREYNVTKNSFFMDGIDSDLNISVFDKVDANVTGSKIQTFDGNATFYYARVRSEDIKTSENMVSSKTFVQIYSSSLLSGFQRATSSWYINKEDDFSIIALTPKDKRVISSSNNIYTSATNLQVANGGSITYDITNTHDKSYKAYYHLDVPAWLWYSRYSDYDGSSDCSEHPCFEYIFESEQNGIIGIRSGDFNGTRFENNFKSGAKKRAIKLMR